MAKTKRQLILLTCVLSALAAGINFVSLGTQGWIINKSKLVGEEYYQTHTVQYGLFKGFHSQIEPTSTVFLLDMTCSISDNKCALICGGGSYLSDTLETLINNDTIIYTTKDDSCTTTVNSRNFYIERNLRDDNNNYTIDHTFINAGVRNSTIAFLILSAFFGILASGLSLLNTITNPIQFLLSTFGIVLCNGAAFCCSVLAMILWGVMYSTTLTKNIGYFMTIIGMLDSRYTTLGYSYWIIFASKVLYASSMVVLFTRRILVNREPPEVNVHLEGPADPNIYLF